MSHKPAGAGHIGWGFDDASSVETIPPKGNKDGRVKENPEVLRRAKRKHLASNNQRILRHPGADTFGGVTKGKRAVDADAE